jgi:hypothetical protein
MTDPEDGGQRAMQANTAGNTNLSPTLQRIQRYSAWLDAILI